MYNYNYVLYGVKVEVDEDNSQTHQKFIDHMLEKTDAKYLEQFSGERLKWVLENRKQHKEESYTLNTLFSYEILTDKVNEYTKDFVDNVTSVEMVDDYHGGSFVGVTIASAFENHDHFLSAPWLTEDLTKYDGEIQAVLDTFKFLIPDDAKPELYILTGST